MPPGENALGPFRAQQLLADKHRQHLAGEDLGEPHVVDPRDLMEDSRLVHAALGRQEMEVHVKVDPVPEGLDGGDDPGRKRALGHNLEGTAQGPEGAPAEIAEEKKEQVPIWPGSNQVGSFPPFLYIFRLPDRGQNRLSPFLASCSCRRLFEKPRCRHIWRENGEPAPFSLRRYRTIPAGCPFFFLKEMGE